MAFLNRLHARFIALGIAPIDWQWNYIHQSRCQLMRFICVDLSFGAYVSISRLHKHVIHLTWLAIAIATHWNSMGEKSCTFQTNEHQALFFYSPTKSFNLTHNTSIEDKNDDDVGGSGGSGLHVSESMSSVREHEHKRMKWLKKRSKNRKTWIP